MSKSRQIRIGLIGPQGAGKTTLARRFADSNYVFNENNPEKSTPNLDGVFLATPEAKARSNLHQALQRQYNLDVVQIREIGGDTRNQGLVRGDFGPGRKGKQSGDVDVVMLVADLSGQNPNAMNDLQSWMDCYKNAFGDLPPNQRPPVMLIGARADQYQSPEFDTFLGQQVEEVSDEFSEFAKKNGLDPIIFTSAKTGEGIDEAFAKASDLVLNAKLKESQQQSVQSYYEPPVESVDTREQTASDTNVSSSGKPLAAKSIASVNDFTSIPLDEPVKDNLHLSSTPPANSILGAITGGFLGALSSLVVHNPLFCLFGSLEKSEWKQWGPLNVVRVLLSPIVNPIAAVIDGIIEGGAMGYRGGVREAVKVPAEVLRKAPFFVDKTQTTIETKEGTGKYVPLRVQESKVEVSSHQEGPTKFGRFFQLPSKFQTSSEKKASELSAQENVSSSHRTTESSNKINQSK